MGYDREDFTQRRQRQIVEYMEMKYGREYMDAISKLNSPNQYDEKGYLKPEYQLTDKERDALLYYVPEVAQLYQEQEVFNEMKIR